MAIGLGPVEWQRRDRGKVPRAQRDPWSPASPLLHFRQRLQILMTIGLLLLLRARDRWPDCGAMNRVPAADLTLSADVMKKIDAVTKEILYPMG